MKGFVGLHEFIQRLGTDEQCREWVKMTRWGGGFTCPRCQNNTHYTYLKTRQKFQCNRCMYHCSVTAGTIFQDTKLPLSKWFLAAYFLLTTKKGISTPDLARKIDVSQSTAWFLTQKIMLVLDRTKAFSLFGIVEVDETFIGGKTPGSPKGRGTTKETILGMVEQLPERLGDARFHHIPDAAGIVLETVIREEICQGSTIRTDGWRGYNQLKGYTHVVKKQVETREGRDLPAVHLLFSNLKRVVKGVHTHLSPGRMQRYLELFTYRYNWRDDLWSGFYRASLELGHVPPRTYAQIIAATAE